MVRNCHGNRTVHYVVFTHDHRIHAMKISGEAQESEEICKPLYWFLRDKRNFPKSQDIEKWGVKQKVENSRMVNTCVDTHTKLCGHWYQTDYQEGRKYLGLADSGAGMAVISSGQIDKIIPKSIRKRP